MEDLDHNNSDRLVKMLDEVGERVESLREQAISIQKERESILELLQDMQGHADHDDMQEVEREDIESTTERLILRCLTVEVSVSTPRNDIQEESYKSVTCLMDDLDIQFRKDPKKHSSVVESYLNACLPEPLSTNIDTRFQSKVLGCTIDDQKSFRQKLEGMFQLTMTMTVCNGNVQNGDGACSTNGRRNSPEGGKTVENKTVGVVSAET